MIGTTGLINVPTADMQPDGTFDGGARWAGQAAYHDLINYDTGLYYVRFTPFSFFEFTFRETLCKTQHSVKKNLELLPTRSLVDHFACVLSQNVAESGGRLLFSVSMICTPPMETVFTPDIME